MNLTAADFHKLFTSREYGARDERERIVFSCVIRQAEKIEELEAFIKENIPQSILALAQHVAKMTPGAAPADARPPPSPAAGRVVVGLVAAADLEEYLIFIIRWI